MLVSILHRITGGALTVAGLAALTWWLLAAAKGGAAHEDFSKAASHWAGLVVLIGLTWAFFQHTFSGIRHLLMDTGMNFDLKPNKNSAIATIIASVICTAAVWAFALGVAR
jgi:succinate dehydrogenase / fumarate reductase cytochrome b subunit